MRCAQKSARRQGGRSTEGRDKRHNTVRELEGKLEGREPCKGRARVVRDGRKIRGKDSRKGGGMTGEHHGRRLCAPRVISNVPGCRGSTLMERVALTPAFTRQARRSSGSESAPLSSYLNGFALCNLTT